MKFFQKLLSLKKILCSALIFLLFQPFSLVYATTVNNENNSEFTEVFSTIIPLEESTSRLPNFIKLIAESNDNMIRLKITNYGLDRLDKVSLNFKIVDAYGNIKLNKTNLPGKSVGVGTTILYTYNGKINTVQEDLYVTGNIYDGRETIPVNSYGYRGNFKGGKYYSLSAMGGERHHMPAGSILPSHISRNNGPAINMTKADHRKTASYGSSTAAKEYRQKQANLIKQGNFAAAQDMDIRDIRNKFGSKYNKAIDQAVQYAKSQGYR